MLRQRFQNELRLDVFMHAVGGDDEHVARLQRHGAIVDVELRMDAEGAAQIALVLADDDAMFLRQWFGIAAAQQRDATVADMEQVRRGRLEDDAAEGADVAAILVEAALALLRLRIQPGVGRGQRLERGGLDRPGFRGAVVVVEKTVHRELRGEMAEPRCC
jgi:hypothetical protein